MQRALRPERRVVAHSAARSAVTRKRPEGMCSVRGFLSLDPRETSPGTRPARYQKKFCNFAEMRAWLPRTGSRQFEPA
jgi:hypothetical protein